MYFAQAEAPCPDEQELTMWKAFAHRNGYAVGYCNGQATITGYGLTRDQAEEISDFVQKYPIHSVFIRGEK